MSAGLNRLKSVTPNSGGWHTYRSIRLGRARFGTGLQSLRITPINKKKDIVMDLGLLTLSPVRQGG